MDVVLQRILPTFVEKWQLGNRTKNPLANIREIKGDISPKQFGKTKDVKKTSERSIFNAVLGATWIK